MVETPGTKLRMRIIWELLIAALILTVACIALIYGYAAKSQSANEAVSSAKRNAAVIQTLKSNVQCLEGQLTARSGDKSPTAQLIDALNTASDAQSAALGRLKNATTRDESAAAFNDYTAASTQQATDLAAIKTYLETHPIGTC